MKVDSASVGLTERVLTWKSWELKTRLGRRVLVETAKGLRGL